MRVLKIFSCFVIILCSITACQKATDVELKSTEVGSLASQTELAQSFDKIYQQEVHSGHIQTVKPGAAITFTSDFSGPLAIGEIAPIQIQLSPEYSQGSMSVEIIGTEGLLVQGETSFTKSFLKGDQVVHELLISAEAPGEYRLGIVASVVTDSGFEESRAFSETISVGAEANTVSLEEAKAGLVGQSSIQSQQVDSEPNYLEAIEEVYIVP